MVSSGTGGSVRYREFSVRVDVSGMVSSVYGWRCQVWSVQCTGGGVRYGELRLRVEVSATVLANVHGHSCQMHLTSPA